jgi:hypothetical protein
MARVRALRIERQNPLRSGHPRWGSAAASRTGAALKERMPRKRSWEKQPGFPARAFGNREPSRFVQDHWQSSSDDRRKFLQSDRASEQIAGPLCGDFPCSRCGCRSCVVFLRRATIYSDSSLNLSIGLKVTTDFTITFSFRICSLRWNLMSSSEIGLFVLRSMAQP